MEKIKIKTVIDTGKKYQDKSIFSIELEDGRKGSSFESDALKWSGEMELEIKEGKEYQGQKQFIFSLPKPQNQKGNFPMKDYTFDKKKASLECAINSIKLTDNKVTSVNIIALATEYFNYLNTK